MAGNHKRSRLVSRDTRDRIIHRPKTLFLILLHLDQAEQLSRQTDRQTNTNISLLSAVSTACVCTQAATDNQPIHLYALIEYKEKGGYRYIYISLRVYRRVYRLILRWKLAGSHPRRLDIYICVYTVLYSWGCFPGSIQYNTVKIKAY